MLILLAFLFTDNIFCVEYGIDGFIEYHKGDVGIIVAAPHGGLIGPDSIPDRRWGTIEPDDHTRHLAFAVGEGITQELDGREPNLVISNLKRRKLDPNRDIEEAAQGSPLAMQAWLDYHGFIDDAKAEFVQGVVIDLHGQSHRKNSTEMGYLLSTESLNKGDFDIARSSVRSLAEKLQLSGEEVMAGENSIGDFLEREEYLAFPSSRQPSPGDWQYFPGGYTVVRHSKGTFDAISVETPREVRIEVDKAGRHKFGVALGKAIAKFYKKNYKLEYRNIKRGLDGYRRGIVPQWYLDQYEAKKRKYQ